MRCENYLCIYWKDKACILESVSMDMLGMCSSCIYVPISEDVLMEARTFALKEQANRHKKWNLDHM